MSSESEAFSKTAAQLPRWKLLLGEHRDHVEMTLKVAVESPSVRPDRHEFSSGGDYLRALHTAMRGAHADPEFRARVERLLDPITVTSRWQTRDERSIEWNALVVRSRVAEMNTAGEMLRRESADTPFLLSGPWPLEVFAEHDHE